jgi:arylformamidase
MPLPLLTDAEREREYSPSSCIGGDWSPYLRTYQERSRVARQEAQDLGGRWIEARYGLGAAQRIDLCLPAKAEPAAAPPCPLLAFIHGGYWQALGAEDSLFAAAHCIERGIAFAAIDYTLAPQARLDDIVAECREAYGWLARQAPYQGIDPARIVVAGSSAGAHLAAMVSRLPLDPACVVPPPRAAVLVSGIFDLQPLIGTSINDALGLDDDSARRNSPAWLPLPGFPLSLVCWGEIETPSFKSQSRGFAQALTDCGTVCHSFEVPQRNHFDVILDLAEPGTRLGEATLDLLRA